MPLRAISSAVRWPRFARLPGPTLPEAAHQGRTCRCPTDAAGSDAAGPTIGNLTMAFSDPLQPLLGLAPNRGNQDFGGEAASPLDPAESDYLRRMAGRMARLGGWRLDLQPVRLSWSPETTEIHEEAADVAPD